MSDFREKVERKGVIGVLAVSTIFVAPTSTSAIALSEDEKAALATTAIVGIAVWVHKKYRYNEGWEPTNSEAKAQFERGYGIQYHSEQCKRVSQNELYECHAI
ncbi:hypothetical protein [Ruegeria sp. HKCCA5426]|uniref:hypothetical protein n=1 Tax=Ruegeria sp. HKCCA5426 TaxID=2682985 RepID=UPI0014879EC7|nr:hypothetical protein [Ruegeria sp. HKCCA5426]